MHERTQHPSGYFRLERRTQTATQARSREPQQEIEAPQPLKGSHFRSSLIPSRTPHYSYTSHSHSPTDPQSHPIACQLLQLGLYSHLIRPQRNWHELGKRAQITRLSHARLIPKNHKPPKIIIYRKCRRSRIAISSAHATGSYETVGINRQPVQLG